MTILEAYKRKEAMVLKERGLLMVFTAPLSKHDPALLTWKKHLQSVGAPYLVISNGQGFAIWKERKDFRCKHCGAFLNTRPKKQMAYLTHKMVDRECIKR